MTEVEPTSLRIGDADRDSTHALLGEALAQGYLTMPEFEERSGAVLAARTSGELRAVLVDLPVGRIAPPAGSPPVQLVARTSAIEQADAGPDQRRARAGFYAHLASYVAGVSVMLGIWLVVGLTAGAWYFWPVWPILGWGIGVASHARPALTGRGGSCHRRPAVTR